MWAQNKNNLFLIAVKVKHLTTKLKLFKACKTARGVFNQLQQHQPRMEKVYE